MSLFSHFRYITLIFKEVGQLERKQQTYGEGYVRDIEYAERYTKDNVDTPHGMNREEGPKKKNKIK